VGSELPIKGFRLLGLIPKPWVILDDVPKANAGGKSMFHLVWYILIRLISGVIAKSVMHVHITIFWTIVLGIIGSIIGGGVTHMFSRPTNERYHPAGLILSTLGAIMVLFICYKLKIHFPDLNLGRN
jgi:uncharacterized membrane protein YeaQ/YmgE (transglycosylase-associated protein family)